LFREIAAALETDPGRTSELIAKWRAIVDFETGGDTETKAALSRALINHRNWPAGYQRYVASLYDTTVETWMKVANLLASQASERDHLPT